MPNRFVFSTPQSLRIGFNLGRGKGVDLPGWRRWVPALGALLAACGLAIAVAGCSISAPSRSTAQTQAGTDGHTEARPERTPADRAAALAAVVQMPTASQFETRYFDWMDSQRLRPVAVKLYLPLANPRSSTATPAPLAVFSHGIGGSREGYSYIGQHLAANGIASLHLQHAGSDRSVWSGSPIKIVTRLQAAAQDSEAIDRVLDLQFALTQTLMQPDLLGRLDANRIAAAGHSYGANTTMLAVGARVARAEQTTAGLADPRIKAAIIISAPPFYGETDLKAILQGITVPSLHITATADDIQIPGYYSPAKDRLAVFEAMGGASKTLAVFTGGSHSMFTDRLGTGGAELNPKVKTATRDLSLAFLQAVFESKVGAMADWQVHNAPLLTRFEPSKR